MEENKEVNKEVEQKEEEVTQEVPEVKDDRPEINYKAELERKNRELERVRMELASRQQEPVKRDPNDLKTWNEHELKAIINSNDPSVLPYKDQAHDILLDRKVDARLAKQQETNKRVHADLELRNKYPEALDPTSELSMKIDQLMTEHDLSRTPAGRLVAAKLAAAELNQGKNVSNAKGQKAEKDRVASVKSQMVDGDRPKSTDNNVNLDEKRKSLAEKLINTNKAGNAEKESNSAMNEIIQDRFGGREGFFGKR